MSHQGQLLMTSALTPRCLSNRASVGHSEHVRSMKAPPRNPHDSWDPPSTVPGTPPEVLHPCLTRSLPSPIHGGASTGWTCSRTSHGCSIGLVSREFRTWDDALSDTPTVIERVVLSKWHPCECQEPRFPSRTLHFIEMIRVIYFTCQWF